MASTVVCILLPPTDPLRDTDKSKQNKHILFSKTEPYLQQKKNGRSLRF